MNHHTQGAGNAFTDGLLLCLLAAGGWLSELTMSSYIAFITAMGGTLYVVNQLITIIKNLNNNRPHDRADKKSR